MVTQGVLTGDPSAAHLRTMSFTSGVRLAARSLISWSSAFSWADPLAGGGGTGISVGDDSTQVFQVPADGSAVAFAAWAAPPPSSPQAEATRPSPTTTTTAFRHVFSLARRSTSGP